MSKSRYYILIGIALLIAVAFIPQTFLEKTAFRFFQNSSKLGDVKEVIGRAEKTFVNATQWQTVSANQPVKAGDTYITHGDSKILFAFNPPFWLMPFSKIEFLHIADGSGENVVAHLIYGQIKKLPADENAPNINLTYEDQLIKDDEFSSSADEVLETELLPVTDKAFQDITLDDATPQNVTEKQIFQTLLLQKKFFQGCLIRLYKKQNGSIKGGETLVDLLIQVNGVIEKATINKSDIQDQEYLNCLKQVFERVRFKNLQIKEPLHALFPLNIEMP